VLPTAAEVFAAAGVMLKVQPPTVAETAQLRPDAVLVSLIRRTSSRIAWPPCATAA